MTRNHKFGNFPVHRSHPHVDSSTQENPTNQLVFERRLSTAILFSSEHAPRQEFLADDAAREISLKIHHDVFCRRTRSESLITNTVENATSRSQATHASSGKISPLRERTRTQEKERKNELQRERERQERSELATTRKEKHEHFLGEQVNSNTGVRAAKTEDECPKPCSQQERHGNI